MKAVLVAVNLSNGRCMSETFTGPDAIKSCWDWKRAIEFNMRDVIFTIVADAEAIAERKLQMGEYEGYDYIYSGIGSEPK